LQLDAAKTTKIKAKEIVFFIIFDDIDTHSNTKYIAMGRL